MVFSEVRKTRPIAAVDRFDTTLSVSATRASIESAGWQQVKMSRSRSSSIGLAVEAGSSPAWSCIVSSMSLLRSVARRRRT